MDTRENSPLNVSESSDDLVAPKPWYKQKSKIILFSILGIAIIGIPAAFYSDYIGARVAPGLRFRILGPSTLTIGKDATITWDTSTAGAQQYPYEKIEYCFGKKDKVKCRVLVSVAPNNGSATVKVPASLPVGRGYIKLTARDANKKLIGNFAAVSDTVTVFSPKGSNSGGPNQNPSLPSAEFIEPIDDELVIGSDPLDVRVQLTETNTNKLSCQEWLLDGVPIPASKWDGGQSPDLSAAPCQ